MPRLACTNQGASGLSHRCGKGWNPLIQHRTACWTRPELIIMLYWSELLLRKNCLIGYFNTDVLHWLNHIYKHYIKVLCNYTRERNKFERIRNKTNNFCYAKFFVGLWITSALGARPARVYCLRIMTKGIRLVASTNENTSYSNTTWLESLIYTSGYNIFTTAKNTLCKIKTAPYFTLDIVNSLLVAITFWNWGKWRSTIQSIWNLHYKP